MGGRIVVSNSTPLIAFAWLNHLELLPKLFGTIHIPQAVYDEIQFDPIAVGAAELKSPDWLNVTAINDQLAVNLLLDQLDAGESEALVLAHELNAELLLMESDTSWI